MGIVIDFIGENLASIPIFGMGALFAVLDLVNRLATEGQS